VTLVAFVSSTVAPSVAWAEPQAGERVDERMPELGDREVAVQPRVDERMPEVGERDVAAVDASSSSDVESAADLRDLLESLPIDRSLPDGLSSLDPDREPQGPRTQALVAGAKSGATSQAISAPKGSGKLDGMGESFSAQLSTGIATFNVPFAIPAARGGAQASLGLSYSSGSGSGVVGMGWGVGVPFIARQTDRGLPSYDDRAKFHPGQDRFVFNGGQELVPICNVSASLACACVEEQGGACVGGAAAGEVMPPWSAGHQYFRSRVEGGFLRFFWSPDHRTWRVQDKSGVTMELGVPLDGSKDATALEVNPDAKSEIYKWHLVRQYDTYGEANPPSASELPAPFNVVVYRYKKNGGQAYLTDIFHTTPAADPATTDVEQFAHHVRLKYETRPDRTFSYRSGFLLEQNLRLERVDVASKPFGGGEESPRHLLRRYHLTYDRVQHVSLLASLEVEGRCAEGGASDPNGPVAEADTVTESGGALPEITDCPRLPPMTFEYTHVEPFTTDGAPGLVYLAGYEGFDERIREIASSPPHSITEGTSALFDIDSDALPDMLVTAPGKYGPAHGVFFNAAGGRADRFGSAVPMGMRGVLGAGPGTLKLSNLNVVPLDLDGDATADLLHMPAAKRYALYTPSLVSGNWTWVGRAVDTASQQNVKIALDRDAPETRVLDVNFDGLVDVVVSSGKELQTFYSLGRFPGGDGQFGQASRTGSATASISNDPVRTCLPTSGNPVRFSDGEVHIAEMNGDGIPDIVRMRRGDIHYWPGRGNGVWGTGKRDDCPANSFANGREITMTESPEYSDIDGVSLRIDDVNGDGLDDLVQVRYADVDIWLNVDGTSWTKRHMVRDTPPSPSHAERVHLVDINGSGTRDILWGRAGNFSYIDLQGGRKPWLLSRVENGLGKSTDLEYSTSTEEMLTAAAFGGNCDPAKKPWASPWCSKMPTVAHVVKRVIESDNLKVAGQPRAQYITEYDYRDPVFEGRQREFRGFKKARARRLGDANSPTDITESTFLLGECKDDVPDDGTNGCDPSERYRDNPREALKGLPVLTEKYDERGVYLSTEATTYRLRRLYEGLDGREVRHAFETGKRTLLYDTALGASSSSNTTPQPSIELELAPDNFNANTDDPLALSASATVDETQQVPVRTPSGRAELATRAVVDIFGNRIVAAAQGCVAGSACPGAEPGIVPDETIFSYTLPARPTGEQTGWLYRTGRTYVKGSVHTDLRKDTTTTYTPEGDQEHADVALAGVLPLDRAVAASLPSGGAQNGTVRVSTRVYSDLGTLSRESGANGRCRALTYDSTYGVLATTEEIHRDGSGTCADPDPLQTDAIYDRGLSAIALTTNVQRVSTFVDYDPFGRLSELRRPADASSTRPTLPSVRIEYYLPTSESLARHSVIRTLSQDGATAADADYLETFAYIDGMGRTRASLAEAEEDAPGDWIVGSLEQYDSKGAVSRKYLARYTSEDPADFSFASTPETPYGNQRYDAFGRQLQTFDVDGTVTLQSRYHALSTDLFDAADLEAGPHQNTPATTRKDGHGRDISTTERLHSGSNIAERHTRTRYLTTGEPEAITRVRGNGSDLVTRWMRYDSLGRLLLNVEPNTTENYDDDPATDPTPGASGLKAWRYEYNNAGDLIGTSDARGCGQNFYYDGAGRLTAEDYAPCEAHHEPYSAPNVVTGAGVEVLYAYDGVSAALLPTFTRPPSYAPGSPLLRGQLAAVFSRGSVAFTTYDYLGRTVRTELRVAKPNPNTQGLADRYATRWYGKDFAYDAADREIATTTGATATALQGAAQSAFGFPTARASSVVTTTYTERGTVKRVAGSYGTLVDSVKRTADGLVEDIVYGDAAGTTTSYQYDDRRRVRTVQTYRGEPSLWTSPPSGYQPAPVPGGTTTFQLLLQDEEYQYDPVNNPIEIRDWRIADEWPAGAKPVTRKIQYDDLYRVKRIDHEYAAGDDTWTSPFSPELASIDDPRRAEPSPHVAFDKRILWQTFNYDWLGNTSKTDDDARGFYDRSLGTVTNDTAGDKPYQLKSATNDALGGTRTGAVDTVYDAAGNLTRLDVERNGTCLGAECSQRFDYRWDEVGRLVRARRWDVAGSSLTTPDAALPNDSEVDADLEYVYDASDDRVLKTARAGSAAAHTAYVFDTLELRRTAFQDGDYTSTIGSGVELTESEVPYLFGHGVRLARVVFEQVDDGEPRVTSSGRQHVFFELGDHLGSTSVVLDKETSELVERGAFQASGAKESDYRPDRWKGFREDYGFTGKEEDVEVGLTYFGKRFLSPYLGRWVSADPLGVHAPGESDANLYAYVLGQLLRGVDPLGLECGTNESCRTASGAEVVSTDNPPAASAPAAPSPAPNASQGASNDSPRPQKSFLNSREVKGIAAAIDQTIDGIKELPELPGRILSGDVGLVDLAGAIAESMPTSEAVAALDAAVEGDGKEVFRAATLGFIGVATLGASRLRPGARVPGMAEAEAALQKGVETAGKFPEGSFSITDWSGYPEGMARPNGPVRILTGDEYVTARGLADETNAKIRAANGLEGSGFHIHELKPVKFGGSPTDVSNKVLLPAAEHVGPQGVHSQFWTPLQRWATGGGG
jgi:RHS repeat-associated protein